jgi:hypothetical protein
LLTKEQRLNCNQLHPLVIQKKPTRSLPILFPQLGTSLINPLLFIILAAMQSINATAYSDPSGYQLSSLPKPDVTDAKDVVIKVHAASINPIDVKKAAGAMKMILKDSCVPSALLWSSSSVRQTNSHLPKIGFRTKLGTIVLAQS